MHISRPARCVADTIGRSTTPRDTRLRVCELGLACFGLLRHNSMATWRQLPGCTTTKPVVLFIGRLRSYTPPDGIRSDIRVDPTSAVRRLSRSVACVSDGSQARRNTKQRPVVSYLIPLLFDRPTWMHRPPWPELRLILLERNGALRNIEGFQSRAIVFS